MKLYIENVIWSVQKYLLASISTGVIHINSSAGKKKQKLLEITNLNLEIRRD